MVYNVNYFKILSETLWVHRLGKSLMLSFSQWSNIGQVGLFISEKTYPEQRTDS